jgi:Uma2 family endonuclease
MIRSGVFDGRAGRIELLEGILHEMPAISDAIHDRVIERLKRWSTRVLPRTDVLVRVKETIAIPEQNTVLIPDLAWVAERKYGRKDPTAEDVLLAIEVANEESLDYDRGRKAKLYARSGIREYWVVSIPDEHVEVYQQPKKRGYDEMLAYGDTPSFGEEVSPLAVPTVSLIVKTLFK